jgi:hypothetical protein
MLPFASALRNVLRPGESCVRNRSCVVRGSADGQSVRISGLGSYRRLPRLDLCSRPVYILQLAQIVDGCRVSPIAIGCVSAFGLS